jgi:hypothetical protein
LLVSAVIADPANFRVLAIPEISSPAFATRVVMAAVPADADALPVLPFGNPSSHFVYDACHFMPGNAGILDSGPQAFFRKPVTVANATGLHLDSHLPRARLRNFALDDLKSRSRTRNLRHFHLSY